MFRPLRRSRQELSREECVAILRDARRATLAVAGDDGYPYAVPINFLYDEDTGSVFFHGARQGHKADAMAREQKVCLTVTDEGTLEEGSWWYHVRSVVVFGHVRVVEDESEKERHLRAFGLKYAAPDYVEREMARDGRACELREIVVDHMCGKAVKEK